MPIVRRRLISWKSDAHTSAVIFMTETRHNNTDIIDFDSGIDEYLALYSQVLIH